MHATKTKSYANYSRRIARATGEAEKLLKPVPGETYGESCNRLEQAVKAIIDTNESSLRTLRVLARALMEAPADFDDVSSYRPFTRAQKFLAYQNESARSFFRKECESLPRRNNARINLLLRKGTST